VYLLRLVHNPYSDIYNNINQRKKQGFFDTRNLKYGRLGRFEKGTPFDKEKPHLMAIIESCATDLGKMNEF